MSFPPSRVGDGDGFLSHRGCTGQTGCGISGFCRYDPAVVLWITNGRVLDARDGRFLALDMAIHGERIARLVERGSAGPARGDAVVDAGGMHLLPGLINCHVHLTVDSRDADPA